MKSLPGKQPTANHADHHEPRQNFPPSSHSRLKLSSRHNLRPAMRMDLFASISRIAPLYDDANKQPFILKLLD